jgi:hypothetical protein
LRDVLSFFSFFLLFSPVRSLYLPLLMRSAGMTSVSASGLILSFDAKEAKAIVLTTATILSPFLVATNPNDANPGSNERKPIVTVSFCLFVFVFVCCFEGCFEWTDLI